MSQHRRLCNCGKAVSQGCQHALFRVPQDMGKDKCSVSYFFNISENNFRFTLIYTSI